MAPADAIDPWLTWHLSDEVGTEALDGTASAVASLKTNTETVSYARGSRAWPSQGGALPHRPRRDVAAAPTPGS